MTMNENVKKEKKTFFYVCLGGILQLILNKLPDELETWNLDHSSEEDDNEWKCKKRRKKQKGGEINKKMFRPITVSSAFVLVHTLLIAT